jgi:hypothetical protein
MKRPLMKICVATNAFVLAVLGLASPATAYIGPGAGSGGTASTIGMGGWIVIIVAGGLGLCLLCGLIALAIAAGDRLKSWAASRHRAGSTQAGTMDQPGS